MGLPFEMDPTPPPALPGESMTQANFRRAATLLADLLSRHLERCPAKSLPLAEALTDFYAARRDLSR